MRIPLSNQRRPKKPPYLAVQLALVLSALLGVMLGCSGCTTTTPTAGTPAALQTFNGLYASAVQSDALVLIAADTALKSGAINAAQAKAIEKVADQVKLVLDAANSAAQLGNSSTATSNLGAAVSAIAQASSCLTLKPLTPTTFATCIVKLTPPQVQT